MPYLIKTYIGTKIIRAYPERTIKGDDMHVIYEDGYESWSPKAAFDRAHREVTEAEKVMMND